MLPRSIVTLAWIGTALAALDAVVVDEGARLVDAVRELLHDVAALALGLVENLRDGVENGVPAVFVEQLVHAPHREPARRHLRFHVAERGFREADVVLEHAVERLVELAAPRRSSAGRAAGPSCHGSATCRAGAEAGRHAADVDPMRAHHGEHKKLALVEIRRVDDDVVEVLAGDRLVIGDDRRRLRRSPSRRKRSMASVMMTPRSATKCDTPPTFCEISSPLVLTSEVQKSRTS